MAIPPHEKDVFHHMSQAAEPSHKDDSVDQSCSQILFIILYTAYNGSVETKHFHPL